MTLTLFRGRRDYTANTVEYNRDKYLRNINEQRGDRSTYKKYLQINLSGDELIELQKGTTTSIIRKIIPAWVKEEIQNGRTVDAYVTIRSRNSFYFIYLPTGQIIKKATNSKVLRRVPYEKIFILNGAAGCAKFKINNIISTEINKDGEYSNSIKDISRISNTSIENLEKYGKLKPIYLINISELTIFSEAMGYGVMLGKFDIISNRNESGETSFTLNVLYEPPMYNNMGTVWI